MASAPVIGVRQLAIVDGLIYLTRGDVDAAGYESGIGFLPDVVGFGDTLDPVGESECVSRALDTLLRDLVVHDEKLYLGVNNAFRLGQRGRFGMGQYDPFTDEYVEWDLGSGRQKPNSLVCSE